METATFEQVIPVFRCISWGCATFLGSVRLFRRRSVPCYTNWVRYPSGGSHEAATYPATYPPRLHRWRRRQFGRGFPPDAAEVGASRLALPCSRGTSASAVVLLARHRAGAANPLSGHPEAHPTAGRQTAAAARLCPQSAGGNGSWGRARWCPATRAASRAGYSPLTRKGESRVFGVGRKSVIHPPASDPGSIQDPADVLTEGR